LLLYVDDLLLLNETQAHSDWFFTELGKQVLLKHTGKLEANRTSRFLGRQLTHRGDNKLLRPLATYIDTMLQLYNLQDCRPLITTGTNLTKRPTDGDEELSTDEHKTFRTAVGKLNIRADISFATKELARNLTAPTQEHLSNLKHLLRYCAGTKNFGLMLKPSHVLPLPSSTKTSLEVHTFCDSDWAGCKTTRKPTTGTVTQLNGCSIHHCSRTQPTVAISSTEAEANALGSGAAEALYLQQLPRETGMFANVSLHVHTDSTGAKAVCTRTGLSPKTKHMQLRYLWLQQIFADSTASLRKIGTLENPADLLTKFVNVNVLEKLTGKIGLIDLNVRLDAAYVNALRNLQEHASNYASCNTGEETVTSVDETTNSTCCLFVPVTFDFVSFRSTFDLVPSSLTSPAMATAGDSLTAPVTVAVTALNFEKGTGKFHLDCGCTGLAKRSSTLLTVELGRATSKGLIPCNYCATGKSGHWTGYKAPLGAVPVTVTTSLEGVSLLEALLLLLALELQLLRLQQALQLRHLATGLPSEAHRQLPELRPLLRLRLLWLQRSGLGQPPHFLCSRLCLPTPPLSCRRTSWQG
jgi:hypothetical protein